MARRPLCRVAGVNKEMPAGEKPVGFWAKAITVPVGGVVTATIPAGLFVALPVIGHAIQATTTRDYIFRLASLTLNADKTITLAGIVRQSALIAVLGGDPFASLTSAVTLHLTATESD